MPTPHGNRPTCRRRGMTMIEILTVLAIIGVLVTILIPTVGVVQIKAREAKTRVQFSQWAAAIEAFRQEYGYYPNFTAFPDGLINTTGETQQFVEALTGRSVTGGTLADGDPGVVAGNTKRIQFYSFGPEELTPGVTPQVQDPFGNTTIVLLTDINFDGMVSIGGDRPDYAAAPAVLGTAAPLSPGDFVRAGVLFYSAGAGQKADDIVTSW